MMSLPCETVPATDRSRPGPPHQRPTFYQERNDESDPKTPRNGPEPLARQHHPRSADQRHAPPLHPGVLGHGAHLEPHDLRPRHQEQSRLRRRHPPEIEGRQVGRGAVLRAGAGGPDSRPPICSGRSTTRPTAWTAGCRWRSRRCWPTTRPDTLAAAKELHARAERPNLFIKIPGTKEGLPAIEEAIFAGVPINVTLLFSREQYVAAAEAYLRGIERRIAAGLNPDVSSVASMFISRWDVAVTGKAPEALAQPARHRHRGTDLQGVSLPDGFAALAADLQRRRPPAAPPLGQHRDQGPHSLRYPVRRRPRRPVHREHDARGHVESPRRSWRDRPGILPAHGGDCDEVLAKFAKAGIDIDALAAQLQDEGAKSFVKSWNELMDCIASKSEALKKAG